MFKLCYYIKIKKEWNLLKDRDIVYYVINIMIKKHWFLRKYNWLDILNQDWKTKMSVDYEYEFYFRMKTEEIGKFHPTDIAGDTHSIFHNSALDSMPLIIIHFYHDQSFIFNKDLLSIKLSLYYNIKFFYNHKLFLKNHWFLHILTSLRPFAFKI
jgi:hypothetical protein